MMRQFIILTLLTIFNYGHSQDTLRVKAYDGLGSFEYLTFKVSKEVYSKIPDSVKNKKKLLKEQLFTQLFMYKLKMKNPTSYTPIYKNNSALVFYSDSRQEVVASFPYKAQNGYGNYLLDEAYIDIYPNRYEKRLLDSAAKYRDSIRNVRYIRITIPKSKNDTVVLYYPDSPIYNSLKKQEWYRNRWMKLYGDSYIKDQQVIVFRKQK